VNEQDVSKDVVIDFFLGPIIELDYPMEVTLDSCESADYGIIWQA